MNSTIFHFSLATIINFPTLSFLVVGLLAGILGSYLFFRRKTLSTGNSEEKTRIQSIRISELNEKLKNQSKEITNQKSILEKQNVKLQKLNRDLTFQKDEIEAQNYILNKQKQYIADQNLKLDDKTEEIELKNQELEELNKTKDKFFSIIAHDLKSPMNALIGLSDLLHQSFDSFPEEKKKKFIGAIASSSKSLYALIENLLHWARSQSGIIPFRPEKVFVNAIINENIYTLKHPAREKEIELIYESVNNVELMADENMLNTIIRNLTNNSIKYTERGGSISYFVFEEPTHVIIQVKDTGIGIASQKIDTLFKIDQNKSTNGTNNETGTGLGLILCKEFADKHKGKIWVESELGVGTSFFVKLPLKTN